NRQTDYAIRMLLSLAKRGTGIRASTSEIQREMVIPHSFAQCVIANLARGSFIHTFPGRDGGVSLARPAREINLRQLLEHFENHLFATDCQNFSDDCPFQRDCPICTQWDRLKLVVSQELEQITVEDLAKNSAAKQTPYIHQSTQRLLPLS
ncbi:MAG TPA: Rrf2 family transcriptional regulator, partial [Anaerolineales bacterium]|nr:Rrf2 family transcriptional regulator [Anaerolineales bacterium]